MNSKFILELTKKVLHMITILTSRKNKAYHNTLIIPIFTADVFERNMSLIYLGYNERKSVQFSGGDNRKPDEKSKSDQINNLIEDMIKRKDEEKSRKWDKIIPMFLAEIESLESYQKEFKIIKEESINSYLKLNSGANYSEAENYFNGIISAIDKGNYFKAKGKGIINIYTGIINKNYSFEEYKLLFSNIIYRGDSTLKSEFNYYFEFYKKPKRKPKTKMTEEEKKKEKEEEKNYNEVRFDEAEKAEILGEYITIKEKSIYRRFFDTKLDTYNKNRKRKS